MSNQQQPTELETLQQARKEGTITDSQRLRLTELTKEAEGESKEKPKTAPAAATKK